MANLDIAERRVPHEQSALAKAIDELLKAGAELVVVFGASAIADRRDVIPAAIETVGGTIEHFGMPVDPGNLMLIGRAGAVPVLATKKLADCPAVTDWASGCEVIDGATTGGLTGKGAALLVMVPALLLTTAVNCAPLSAVVVTGVEYVEEVAPLMAAPFFCH